MNDFNDKIVLDLACGTNPDYRDILIGSDDATVIGLDLNHSPDIRSDLNESLPFGTGSADALFGFSFLYALDDPSQFVAEARRVLRPGGRLFLNSPFIFAENPEPEDLRRYTRSGLKKLIRGQDFTIERLVKIGGRFSASSYLTTPALKHLPGITQMIYSMSIGLDYLIDHFTNMSPAPIEYLIQARVPT